VIAEGGRELASIKDDSKWASSNTVDSLSGSMAKSTFVDLTYKGTVTRVGILYHSNLFRIKGIEHFRFLV
jgi:hypothetical protein